jgi:hypothetical protein
MFQQSVPHHGLGRHNPLGVADAGEGTKVRITAFDQLVEPR